MDRFLFGNCAEKGRGVAKALKTWWAMQGLNLRPHPCEGCAPSDFAAKSPQIEQERCENIGTYLFGFCAAVLRSLSEREGFDFRSRPAEIKASAERLLRSLLHSAGVPS